MKVIKKFGLLFALIFVIALVYPGQVLAHCPLCTAGVGLVALGAYNIGVSGLTIGLLLGAFSAALGIWLGKMITKKYLPGQNNLIAVASWLLTLLPLQTLLAEYASIYVGWSGQYGVSYPINLFLVGGVIGAVLVYLAPRLSRQLTARRGKAIPFQSLAITLALLLLASLITQFVF